MTDPSPSSPVDLEAIEARLQTRIHEPDYERWSLNNDTLIDEDLPELLAEVARLRAAPSPAVDLEPITALLKGIEIFPGERWPTSYYDAETALLADAQNRREASPWIGGTLPAAKFIAEAPRRMYQLLAEVERLRAAILMQQIERWNAQLEGWINDDEAGYDAAIAVISDIATETHKILHAAAPIQQEKAE